MFQYSPIANILISIDPCHRIFYLSRISLHLRNLSRGSICGGGRVSRGGLAVRRGLPPFYHNHSLIPGRRELARRVIWCLGEEECEGQPHPTEGTQECTREDERVEGILVSNCLTLTRRTTHDTRHTRSVERLPNAIWHHESEKWTMVSGQVQRILHKSARRESIREKCSSLTYMQVGLRAAPAGSRQDF